VSSDRAELIVDGGLAGCGRVETSESLDFASLRAALADFPSRRLELEDRRHAAVAAVICPSSAGELCFLLTRRAGHLRRHRGQWALPGGRLDPGETPEEAARRELEEELRVKLGAGAVVTRLDDYATRSGFVITPVVLMSEEPLTCRPDANEVASVHAVPFSVLEREDCPRLRTIPESDRPVLSIPILEHWIHAPTAAIVYQLFEAVQRRRVVRVAAVEQPVFAWR
jgi:8-oxo-dGTP pyrophosphatase MutT (NUDIX family)